MPPTASFSVKKYLPNVVGSSFMRAGVYHGGMCRPLAVTALLLWAAGCGSDSRTLELVRVQPQADPGCGAASDGRTLLVTALGDFPRSEATAAAPSLSTNQRFSIDSFPAETRMLEVVVIGSGGVVRTVGRTAELDLTALDDGAEVPVFMAPPRGFCPTGDGAGAPRVDPLVVAAGSGALVVGGTDGSGAPVTDALWYDPGNGAFTSLGDVFYTDDHGLLGASTTQMPDGRVAIVGGGKPGYQLYDPEAQATGRPGLLDNLRAHHAAVAVDDTHLLLAGGCGDLEADGSCTAGSALLTTVILDVDTGAVEDGPMLARPRIDGTAIREADGRVLLVGGVDDSGAPAADGERIDPAGNQASEIVAGATGVARRLPDGGTLVALAPSGTTAAATASVVPAGESAARSVTDAPAPRTGATLTTLDDGRVLVMGGQDGAAGPEALLYSPQLGRFDTVDAILDPGDGEITRDHHGAALLPDGSVLVVGGRSSAGDPLGDAWIFRPDLTGPYTADATVTFDDPDGGDLVLVPRDPSQFHREQAGGGFPPTAVLQSTGSGGGLPSEWAIVAGPRFAGVTLTLNARADGGGMAAILGFVGPGDYTTAVLLPGQKARLYRVAAGQPRAEDTCTGEIVSAAALAPNGDLAEVAVESRGRSLSLTVDGVTLLTCPEIDPPARGMVGIGAVGSGEVRVSSIAAAR